MSHRNCARLAGGSPHLPAGVYPRSVSALMHAPVCEHDWQAVVGALRVGVLISSGLAVSESVSCWNALIYLR